MIESKVICPSCKASEINIRYHTFWMCSACKTKYSCIQGIPKLYLEDTISKEDKELREGVYNSYLAWFYNFWNPFILIPVRPIKISVIYWMIYFLIVFFFSLLVYNMIEWIVFHGIDNTKTYDIFILFALILYIIVISKHPLYAYLLLLAIPVKISLSIRSFKPKKSHAAVHSDFQKEYLKSKNSIQMLDVATGSSNSLFRHGWMNLNADYTAVDLSPGMIIQGMRLMSKQKTPADFVIADATKLPFKSETFDIVTNYGAINGFADPEGALNEMVRVTKKGGKIFFLDEQAYDAVSWLEQAYFKKVLTYHNTIIGCPVELLPNELEDIEVHQVYEFIYICTARKKI